MSTDLDHVPNETRADAMRVEEASATDPMAAQMMRMTAAAWQAAEGDGAAVPPDLAADAVQAVRNAQRAHLDKTRAQAIKPGVHVTLHAYPDGSQDVHVHTPTGLRLTVDGLVRYLADKPADAVRAVAALLEVLAPGKEISRSVQIAGGPDAGPYTRLLDVPGVTLDTIPSYDPLDVIDLARVEIGGIFGARIAASRRRPLGSAPEVP